MHPKTRNPFSIVSSFLWVILLTQQVVSVPFDDGKQELHRVFATKNLQSRHLGFDHEQYGAILRRAPMDTNSGQAGSGRGQGAIQGQAPGAPGGGSPGPSRGGSPALSGTGAPGPSGGGAPGPSGEGLPGPSRGGSPALSGTGAPASSVEGAIIGPSEAGATASSGGQARRRESRAPRGGRAPARRGPPSVHSSDAEPDSGSDADDFPHAYTQRINLPTNDFPTDGSTSTSATLRMKGLGDSSIQYGNRANRFIFNGEHRTNKIRVTSNGPMQISGGPYKSEGKVRVSGKSSRFAGVHADARTATAPRREEPERHPSPPSRADIKTYSTGKQDLQRQSAANQGIVQGLGQAGNDPASSAYATARMHGTGGFRLKLGHEPPQAPQHPLGLGLGLGRGAPLPQFPGLGGGAAAGRGVPIAFGLGNPLNPYLHQIAPGYMANLAAAGRGGGGRGGGGGAPGHPLANWPLNNPLGGGPPFPPHPPPPPPAAAAAPIPGAPGTPPRSPSPQAGGGGGGGGGPGPRRQASPTSAPPSPSPSPPRSRSPTPARVQSPSPRPGSPSSPGTKRARQS